MTEPELVLKTTPPRLLRGATKRDRLQPFWISARERAAILLAAPAGFGKTTVLLDLATAIETNQPEVHLMVLLVDERPEEVTDMRRHVLRGDVVASRCCCATWK